MAEPLDYLGVVGDIEGRLRALGLEPVLVGGMALVILGSRRVTRDFDFVITQPADRLAALVDILYDRGLELASRIDADGGVVATISNRKVAVARLRIDAPDSAYFFNPSTELRIDLYFDFPIAASKLAARATQSRIRGQSLAVASTRDLLQLKEIARAGRSETVDAQDIAFLRALQERSKQRMRQSGQANRHSSVNATNINRPAR